MSVATIPDLDNTSSSLPRTLTATKISALIVATLTPLSVAVGTIPLALVLGGPGLVLMFLASGLLIGLFCIGYIQMARRITRPGAFYNYITKGLGRPSGISSAMVAVVIYTVLQISVYAVQAVVTAEIMGMFGVHLPWQLYFLVQLSIVTVLACRRIDLSAHVSLIIVVLELLMLAILLVAILRDLGLAAFPTDVLSPAVLNQGQWSVAFVFAILCYGGIESGAMYSPEAKNPRRTIPRGLCIAVIVLTASFALVAWALLGVSRVEGLQAELDQNPAGFVFTVTTTYLGTGGLWVLAAVTLLAQVASALAGANYTVRYISNLAREGLLPVGFGQNNKHGAPGRVTVALAVLTAVAILGLAAQGIDPYLEISPIGFGLAAIGSTVLQILASAAVIVYFRRLPASERQWWKTAAAPAIATALLLAALYVELVSFSYITGKDSPEMALIPWIIPLLLVLGFCFARWLRKNRPAVYRDLAAGDTAEEAADVQRKRIAETSTRVPAKE